MSLSDVRDMVSELPRSLADQVVGYAESVERCLPEIFREAKRRQTDKLSREVVFMAGVKKLHWLSSSSYWTLNHSGRLLKSMGTTSIRVGRMDFSIGSEAHQQLRSLVDDLDKMLRDKDISRYLWLSWPELVQELAANGRR